SSPGPSFEVASIKPNNSGTSMVRIRPSGSGRFTAENVPLQALITMAYRLKDFQISGAPGWIRSERYDISAKAEKNPGRDTMMDMLQTLLEDRFQLKSHKESKEMAVYALVVSKVGKLQASTGECGPPPSTPPPLPESGKRPAPPCGGVFTFPGGVSGNHMQIGAFADLLSRLTRRVVLDKTGLTGTYDFDLTYTPDPGQFLLPPPPGAPPLPNIDPNGPSLFTALQEQLGLKLQPQKGPVEMMVIDHIEHPSEN
ncbi:MAG TPA: TIGR03435 family protein, partial [Bryobacteraceae bacterium]|nr:TIGR03435 family protein [Bryobacteraceae bacterium]